jgi:hypothetical protein
VKTIFLDIDGVLVLEDAEEYDDNPPPFDKDCVRIFNEILQETNAVIVLSSDWRMVWDLKRLDSIFKFNGVIKSPLDVTSDLNSRRKEIPDYVQRKAVSDFVILDDMKLEIFPGNFVQCNMKEGLKQAGIKEQILSIFNKSTRTPSFKKD